MTDELLRALPAQLQGPYIANVCRSIAPKRLSRALLSQMLHSRCIERLAMEEIDYNLLF